jgi:hypothetical protein
LDNGEKVSMGPEDTQGANDLKFLWLKRRIAQKSPHRQISSDSSLDAQRRVLYHKTLTRGFDAHFVYRYQERLRIWFAMLDVGPANEYRWHFREEALHVTLRCLTVGAGNHSEGHST